MAAAVPELGAGGLVLEVTPRRLFSVFAVFFKRRKQILHFVTAARDLAKMREHFCVAREIFGVLRGRAPKRLFFGSLLWGVPKK